MDLAQSPHLVDEIEALGASLEKLDGKLAHIALNALPPESMEVLRTTLADLRTTYHEMQRHIDYRLEFEAVAAFARSIRDASAGDELASIIVSQVVTILRTTCTALALRDVITGENIFAQVQGICPFSTGQRVPPGNGLIGRVMATGKPYLTADAMTDAGAASQGDFNAAMGLPLISQGQTIGLLWMTRQFEFSENEVRLMRVISDMAATALHHTRIMKTLAQRSNELTAANKQLQELDDLKAKFINDMSHELRTPVTGLNMILYLLERNGQEKYIQYLSNMKEDVERLTNLSESILDVARLESKLTHARFESVDFNALVAQLADIYKTRAEIAGVGWTFTITESPLMVMGDQNLLLKAVGNLLTNSVSYARHGAVTISTAVDAACQCAILIIEDNGMGIDSIDLPYVFDRFYRGHRVAESNIPGAGLGLAVVKEILDLHHGRIEAESTIGEKTRFTVYLPLNG